MKFEELTELSIKSIYNSERAMNDKDTDTYLETAKVYAILALAEAVHKSEKNKLEKTDVPSDSNNEFSKL